LCDGPIRWRSDGRETRECIRNRNVTLGRGDDDDDDDDDGDDPGDFATIRDLTLNTAQVRLPSAWDYRTSRNSNTSFILGVPGSTTPAVQLPEPEAERSSTLQVVGPSSSPAQNLSWGAFGALARPDWTTSGSRWQPDAQTRERVQRYVIAPSGT